MVTCTSGRSGTSQRQGNGRRADEAQLQRRLDPQTQAAEAQKVRQGFGLNDILRQARLRALAMHHGQDRDDPLLQTIPAVDKGRTRLARREHRRVAAEEQIASCPS